MRYMSADTWLRKGSSVIFDRESLGPLITGGSLVSLREALGWMNAWPSQPPGGGNTVLISGLETCLEAFADPQDAQAFLRNRVKPLIRRFQEEWPQCGLVFGFGKSDKSFEVTSLDEEVRFKRNDGQKVRLSFAMWDGSSTLNVTRIKKSDQDATVGYYVSRIS